MRHLPLSLLTAAFLLLGLALNSSAQCKKCQRSVPDEHGMETCVGIPGCKIALANGQESELLDGQTKLENGIGPQHVVPATLTTHDTKGDAHGRPVGSGTGTDDTTGLGSTGAGFASGLASGLSNTGHHGTPVAKTEMGTQNQLAQQLLLESLRAAAEQKANEPMNRRYRDVIMQTYQRVADEIRRDGAKEYGANQAEIFGPMLDLQLGRQRDIQELNGARRRGELKPGEYETVMAEIEDRTNSGMQSIPHGIVMESFHSNFEKVWSENRPKWSTPDAPASGLPPRGHIGGMLDADPKNPNTLTLSAQDKLAGGDRAGGLAALNAAIANGGTPDAYALRGGLRLDAKDFDGAYQDAKKALELNPGDKGALGVLKSAEGRTTPGLAESLASGAGSGSGNSAGYGNGFAPGGFNMGRTREIPGMTSASTLASSQKLDEARRAMAMGDFSAAVALAQRALELNPNNAAAYNFLSSIYASRGDYKRAIAAASAGLALAPRDAALLNNKAFAENRSKRYRDALGSANGAIEADARNPYSYANRAYAYGGLGDRDSMLSDINRAAGIDPRFAKAAADAAALQLPSNADILFLFPGEGPSGSAPAAPARSKSFGLVVAAGILGGLLLAFGLLSTVLAPLKDSVVSAFTKATRRGPSVHALDEVATAEPVSAAGYVAGAIRGQYEIVRQIGAGGMGMVYEGTDRSLGRRVAIKKMRDELRMNPRERERFIIEAKTVASLHHANIVDIYAIAEEGEDVYLVFEYVDGKTIHDLVQSQGRLSPADSLRVTRAMGEALTYAHSHGVIHRDMKPSNVMLTSGGQVKVMDFGIARMAKDALTRYSMTNTVVGTPPYMAPEQEQGVVRKESDVYSLAICAYEMLTGKLPFIGIGAGMLMNKINMSYIPPARAIAGLPASLDEVFLKAFQADPDQRYHTPQEFAAALEAALGGDRSSSRRA